MKRLLTLILIAGCSAGAQNGSESLAPLPTTASARYAAPSVRINNNEEAKSQFISNFYSSFSGFKSLTTDETIQWGLYWCEALQNGMTLEQIFKEIRVYFQTSNERDMMSTIVATAQFDLCPQS